MANLVLRTCEADMTSYGGFKWPTSGYVEAPDWMPTRDCGNGLHGWLHGHGDGEASSYWDSDCNWLVVSVPSGELINLNGKVKFKCGEVVFCGDSKSAIDYLLENKYEIIALEIAETSTPINEVIVNKNQKIALLIGSEIAGINESLLSIANQITHITMYGNNSSMNVVQATSIALYEITNKLNQ